MDRTLLYYPRIVIQNPQWIRQSIFYWDSVGSIVPDGKESLLENSRETQILIDNGLYRIFRPNESVINNPNLINEFEFLVETNKHLFDMGELARQSNIGYLNENIDWIYESKMYKELARRLIRKSIAIKDKDRLVMDSENVIAYMSLLAKYMANADWVSVTTPSTDSTTHSKLLFPEIKDGKTFVVGDLSLQNVLPVPTENTSLVDIIKFKERRKDELLRFRQVIYEYQDKIKHFEDPSEVRDLSSRFAEQIQFEVANLGKALKSDDIHFLFGSLRNLLAIEAPAMVAAYALQFPVPVKIQMLVAGVVVYGTISLGEYFLAAQNKENERLAKNSYSYLLHAKEEGIINLP